MNQIFHVAFAVAALSGCEQQINQKLAALESAIAQQAGKIEQLEKKVADSEIKLLIAKLSTEQYKSAEFDPAASDGFSRVDTSIGTFAVSIRDVSPHADGAKIKIHIGNLTSAVVGGGKFKVKWGLRPPKKDGDEWATKYREWRNSLSEKDSAFTEELRPGAWNNVTLTLPGVPPDQLGYLELGMETNQIKLITR